MKLLRQLIGDKKKKKAANDPFWKDFFDKPKRDPNMPEPPPPKKKHVTKS